MPTKKRPGLTGVYVELPDEMVAELEALVKKLPIGSKADHIRLAVRRHIDNPPAVIVPSLPPTAIEGKPDPAPAKGKPPTANKSKGRKP